MPGILYQTSLLLSDFSLFARCMNSADLPACCLSVCLSVFMYVCMYVCMYVFRSFVRLFVRSFFLVFTLLVSDSYNRRCTRSCLILLPLLGITWMFGLLSLAGFGIQFDYVFTVLNSAQVSGYISNRLVLD